MTFYDNRIKKSSAHAELLSFILGFTPPVATGKTEQDKAL
jgi:hypothetical protein